MGSVLALVSNRRFLGVPRGVTPVSGGGTWKTQTMETSPSFSPLGSRHLWGPMSSQP